MKEILDIACDEAGHTGPDLLQRDQRYFAYASVALADAEAFKIIKEARSAYAVQMPELKARALLRSKRGRKLIASLLASIEGRYIINIYDKALALCGWFFEYIYEPVYQDDLRQLLYKKNLHRFVAMQMWLCLTVDPDRARTAIEQFQCYMRSLDPDDAPLLFNNPWPLLTSGLNQDPFDCILRFAYGYRDIIIADNRQMEKQTPDSGRWTLDLSISGLWSHLNYWGIKGKSLSVRCDASKPLEANIMNFTGDERDPGIMWARAMNTKERLGWRLLEPVAFVDSRTHSAIQLADVVAGAAVALAADRLPVQFSSISEMLCRHVHHSVMPSLDIIDPSTRSAAVNALVLYDLAKRAERQGAPYENLAEMYRFAEASWVRGESPFGYRLR